MKKHARMIKINKIDVLISTAYVNYELIKISVAWKMYQGEFEFNIIEKMADVELILCESYRIYMFKTLRRLIYILKHQN